MCTPGYSPYACAWSGPGVDGRHPLFGFLSVGVPVGHNPTNCEMTAFAEQIFEAMAPAA
jgi:hypothetical protein